MKTKTSTETREVFKIISRASRIWYEQGRQEEALLHSHQVAVTNQIMQLIQKEKKVKYCACGFPQSYPIPHEHSRTTTTETQEALKEIHCAKCGGHSSCPGITIYEDQIMQLIAKAEERRAVSEKEALLERVEQEVICIDEQDFGASTEEPSSKDWRLFYQEQLR